MNWEPLIRELDSINEQVFSLRGDPNATHAKPNPPSNPHAISRLEAARQLRLDDQHRSFLQNADGWPNFAAGTVSLLSTEQMIESDALSLGQRNMSWISGRAMGKFRKRRKELFIIGVSDCTLDVVCMPVSNGQVQPEVVWLNNTEAEEFSSFQSYFQSFIGNGPAMIQFFAARRANRSDA